MTAGIQVITLRCPSCNADFKIGTNTIFLYCGSCGSGYELQEENLSAIPVYFARYGENQNNFHPFWAFEARIQVTNRETKGGSRDHGLFPLFEKLGVLRLYVPAFLDDLNAKPPKAMELSYKQPELQFIQRQPELNGVTVSRESAEKIADYLVIGSEVEQPDTLRNLVFELTLEKPCIIAIAF
jgi:hypothetical protein